MATRARGARSRTAGRAAARPVARAAEPVKRAAAMDGRTSTDTCLIVTRLCGISLQVSNGLIFANVQWLLSNSLFKIIIYFFFILFF